MGTLFSASGRDARRKSRVSRWISALTVAALLATVLVAVESTAAPTSSAKAASATNWDPGYIIDDSIFYDSNSMDANQVQAFLNSQVPQCQVAAYICLKGYGSPTEARSADRYCAAYPGAPYQTAAQIIDLVARACGINQRVLLVLLQKEQSLVTSPAPSSSAYSAATGMSCPDSAGCDPRYAGFFYQVYFAARQFQVYRLNPTSFGYQAGRTNSIKLNPNASCGTQQVYISNQATAALYIYTPYVPNAAALSNLYGVGDGCSSYGNRNFWRIFSDWFGDPHRYTVADGFGWYWDARGGSAGIMGTPISYLVYDETNGGGWYQRFSGGTLYTSLLGTTAFVANNEFGAKYNEAYGPQGPLGWPTSEQMCAPNGVCFQSFLGGTVTSAAGAGTHILWGGLGTFWIQSGGPYSALGAAADDSEYITSPVVGWLQRFQGGTLASSGVGIYVVPQGLVGSLWTASGDVQGGYGWPTGTYSCVANSCAQNFQNGVLSSTPMWGAHPILWGFESYWLQQGGLSDLGSALDDLRYGPASSGGWMQQFEGAAVTQTVNGPMIRVPYGGIYGYWRQSGSEAGYLGWPLDSANCVGTSCSQRFQAGIVTSGSGIPARAIIGGFIGAWQNFGGNETVGPATTDLRYSTYNAGGWLQQFSAGTITQTVSGVPVFTPDSMILRVWYYYGAESAWMGWPLEAPTCNADGCVQNFQHGVGRSDTAGQVTFTRN